MCMWPHGKEGVSERRRERGREKERRREREGQSGRKGACRERENEGNGMRASPGGEARESNRNFAFRAALG